MVYLYCIFQLPITYPSAEEDLASQEDNVPVAMTTRLRRQSERERERELRELRIRKTTDNMDLLPAIQSDPSGWTVEDVWAFIHSLPGMEMEHICLLRMSDGNITTFEGRGRGGVGELVWVAKKQD